MGDAEYIDLIKLSGGSCTMLFEDGTVSMEISFFGQKETEILGSYSIEGNELYLDGNPTEYRIENNTLTLFEGESYFIMTKPEKAE